VNGGGGGALGGGDLWETLATPSPLPLQCLKRKHIDTDQGDPKGF
jgi:hypothetical protein